MNLADIDATVEGLFQQWQIGALKQSQIDEVRCNKDEREHQAQ